MFMKGTAMVYLVRHATGDPRQVSFDSFDIVVKIVESLCNSLVFLTGRSMVHQGGLPELGDLLVQALQSL